MNAEETRAWRRSHQLDVDHAKQVNEDTQAGGFTVLIPGDPAWPTSLSDLGPRAPYALWAMGRPAVLQAAANGAVGISGSRSATSAGTFIAAELAEGLSHEGLLTVAGGAYGIDGAVHRASLGSGGTTIAVLPSGLDRPYPVGHAQLFEQVARAGLLVSELPPGSTPTRWRLEHRGRIVAALTDATVIVEAGARSSSLRLAREAAGLGRPVGAFPGSVTSPASSGTNLLIQQGAARLVAGTRDVVDLCRTDPARTREHQLEGDSVQRTIGLTSRDSIRR
ncbi:DNA-processing protein DprA [Microbacterium sp. 22303]|uniref:DNA-processing protein DprA n=1 Tax=Microbacterium sp. 22303 TaxID=3453905 RepID=UPI003F851E3E